MLKELVEKKHYRFVEGAKDWREAIRMSCEVLESDGTVEENYNCLLYTSPSPRDS